MYRHNRETELEIGFWAGIFDQKNAYLEPKIAYLGAKIDYLGLKRVIWVGQTA